MNQSKKNFTILPAFCLSGFCFLLLLFPPLFVWAQAKPTISLLPRQRISINEGWRFIRYTGPANSLVYDVRPEVTDRNENKVADSKPTEAVKTATSENVLKPGILPTANDFIKNPAQHHRRPSGIIDFAGFKKDRFYLYQSRWRPDLPMVHILPYWNWPGRTGQVTPVHVFKSGDEAELFLNGWSLGKKKKGLYEYRLRWDSVPYEPGTLQIIAYKNGSKWAEENVSTTGTAKQLMLSPNRSALHANGADLSFITVRIEDKNGLTVPDAVNRTTFSIVGPGEIIATDNGNPADLEAFPSKVRKAFSGLALVIVWAKKGAAGPLKVLAQSPGFTAAQAIIQIKKE